MAPISTLLTLDGTMTGCAYQHFVSPLFTGFMGFHQTEFVDYTAPRTAVIDHNDLTLYATIILS